MSTSQAKITFLGHSTILLTTESGKRAIIDPWLEGNPSCPEALKDPGPLDYICLTHGHFDHSGSASILAKQTGAAVFANWEICSLLLREGVVEEQLQRMNLGGTVSLGEIAVTLTPALHSSSYEIKGADGEIRAEYAGQAGGIVFRLESGKTIYHTGDTALFSDLALIGLRYKPSVALLPIGDRFTMGPEEAAIAAKMIGAPLVIPLHHSTFPLLSGTPQEFDKALRHHAPEVKLEILAPGESTAL